jgi:putative glycerol-1-phosphate prenyltransferase
MAGIRENTSCPLIVGGGFNDAASIQAAWNAGADLVVIGNAIEKQPNDLSWLPDPNAFSKASRLV